MRELLLRFRIRARKEPAVMRGSLPGGHAWNDGGELRRPAVVAAVEELAITWTWDSPC
jgi:hypothetical protein